MNNRESFKKILGEDKVRQFDDLLTGMEKARLRSVNIADEWNPSGTGFKNALMSLVTLSAGAGTGMGIGFKSPITGFLTTLGTLAATAGTGKVIGKIATKAPYIMPEGKLGAIARKTKTGTGKTLESIGGGIERVGSALDLQNLGNIK
jgi:hypothetical protein